MGWMLKVLAFLFALFAISLGSWIVGVPILILVLLPLVRREKRPERYERPERYQRPDVKRPHAPRRYLLAGLFFAFAIIASASGGSLSPIVLTSLGLVTLFWGRIGGLTLLSTIKPVHESIAIRCTLPFVYFSVAELKMTTKEAAKVLASLDGRVVLIVGEKPAVYVVMRSLGLSTGHAERRLEKKLRVLLDVIVPLGAYPQPLDGEMAAVALKERSRLKLKADNFLPSLASLPLQALSVKIEEGFVSSLTAYGRVSGERPSTLPARQKVPPVLFWEVVRELGGKISWPNPDQHSAFLASLFASRGASLGERIIDAGGSGRSTVLVRSSGSQSVELSRAQLRSIVRMYDQG